MMVSRSAEPKQQSHWHSKHIYTLGSLETGMNGWLEEHPGLWKHLEGWFLSLTSLHFWGLLLPHTNQVLLLLLCVARSFLVEKRNCYIYIDHLMLEVSRSALEVHGYVFVFWLLWVRDQSVVKEPLGYTYEQPAYLSRSLFINEVNIIYSLFSSIVWLAKPTECSAALHSHTWLGSACQRIEWLLWKWRNLNFRSGPSWRGK